MIASVLIAATSQPTSITITVGTIADPGPRGGGPDAGGPLTGLNVDEAAFFTSSKAVFEEIDDVAGGLGPLFNANGCAVCHAHPATGGTSPATNPQVAVATVAGATNVVPSFITINGPVREVRLATDGGVHQFYTITGRSDAPVGCSLAQPVFVQSDLRFRIPTPLFGLGLVENTPDANLIAAQNVPLMSSLGIRGGIFNGTSIGTISKFGWKGQTESLLTFAGNAYNGEQGVTNEISPVQLVGGPCDSLGSPEDKTNPVTGESSDVPLFAAFMRFSAPPTPAADNPSIVNGRAKFSTAGCVACHVAQQTTGLSAFTGQSNVIYAPYSDFALHDMGVSLADGIVQGHASGSQFRTAPLWGLGQRLFFLHDGRTDDLLRAILAHSSSGSEANKTVANFLGLSETDQQDILNFLRAL